MNGTPFGRYELLNKIAAGGMAEIFLARQWGEGGFFRDVVIKRLFRHLVEHPRVLSMFQYEARLLAELTHPNIPQVLELGHAEGTWYLAMEFVEGNNVADTWRAGARAGHPMPLPVAVGILMQTCEALHHAHERLDRAGRPLAIVHRDVTPQNIMLTRDGVVKLMDFGVASTAARTDTEAGTVKGTFSYMAPEQVRGRRVDRRADVFSLGVILYELTTGTRLYRGNDVQIMTAIVEHDAPPPTARTPDYPPELEAIVLGALSREARYRVASAADLAYQLEAFAMRHGWLVGPRTLAHHVGVVYPAERVKDETLAMVQAAPDAEPGPAQPLAPELTDKPLVKPHLIPVDELNDSDLHVFDDITEPSPEHADSGFVNLLDSGARETSPDGLERGEDFDFDTLGPIEPILPGEALEGFDDPTAGGDRPVVLLDTRKPKGGDNDYMRNLERRFEDDDDDT